MIWALLIALILASGDSVFINPKVKKHVRRHVENKETKKEILDKVNQYEKGKNDKHIRKLKKLGIKLIARMESEIEDPDKAEKALMVSRDF